MCKTGKQTLSEVIQQANGLPIMVCGENAQVIPCQSRATCFMWSLGRRCQSHLTKVDTAGCMIPACYCSPTRLPQRLSALGFGKERWPTPLLQVCEVVLGKQQPPFNEADRALHPS